MTKAPIANLRSKSQQPSNNEPSARDKLGADFTKRLEEKWRQHGDEVLEAAFKESPTKIAELIARLVSTSEPKADGGYGSCQSMAEIETKLLQSIGFKEPDDISIQAAVEANNRMIDELQAIHQRAQQGQLQ